MFKLYDAKVKFDIYYLNYTKKRKKYMNIKNIRLLKMMLIKRLFIEVKNKLKIDLKVMNI